MARPSVSMPEPIRPKTPTISPGGRRGDVVERAGDGEAGDREHLLAGEVPPVAVDVVEIVGNAAEHCGEHLAARGARRLEQAGVPPVAKHGDAVGDLEDLVEVVRDVDDRDRLLLEPADDAEDELRLLLGERGGRLVHDQDARPPASARAISMMRCSATESRLTSVSGSIEPKPSWSRSSRALSRMAASSTTRKPGPRFSGRSASEMFSATVMSGITEISCGRRRTPGGDRGTRVGEDHLLAVDADRAGVARVDAGQDLHQRRLAGAVRAEERHHLARPRRRDRRRSARQRRRTTCRCRASRGAARGEGASAAIEPSTPLSFRAKPRAVPAQRTREGPRNQEPERAGAATDAPCILVEVPDRPSVVRNDRSTFNPSIASG